MSLYLLFDCQGPFFLNCHQNEFRFFVLQSVFQDDFNFSPLYGQDRFCKKNAHMPKIGRNSKTKTFLGTVEQKECNAKW